MFCYLQANDKFLIVDVVDRLLTFCNMPNVEEMLYNWLSQVIALGDTVFPHPLGNWCMAVRYEWFNNHPSLQNESKSLLECQKLHTRTATCLVSLKLKRNERKAVNACTLVPTVFVWHGKMKYNFHFCFPFSYNIEKRNSKFEFRFSFFYDFGKRS